ncbi:MAG: PCMD domain-containing protein [Muribaculaceae bacterium]|nr:PCMD domain-containing protein [Muribaculaceae bacterium]
MAIAWAPANAASNTEPLRYGDFEHWVTRNIKESRVIGGAHKQVYAVGPDRTIDGDEPYVPSRGTPWASSNVMAKVMGITKTSNAVYPDSRQTGGKCARLTTKLEHCKAIGIINIDVLVAGTLFLGRMFEPITSTSDPYAKMEMGIPFTKRPKALHFDYKVEVPDGNTRTYSSGFGQKKTIAGSDKAEAFILLQRRWEDASGNLYAKRVATARERYSKTTTGWINGHDLKLIYGNAQNVMDLIPKEKSYYARNSKGKMVPVREVGWDSPDASPTHMVVMFSAGSGEPYMGTPGLTLWVDNVALTY